MVVSSLKKKKDKETYFYLISFVGNCLIKQISQRHWQIPVPPSLTKIGTLFFSTHPLMYGWGLVVVVVVVSTDMG